MIFFVIMTAMVLGGSSANLPDLQPRMWGGSEAQLGDYKYAVTIEVIIDVGIELKHYRLCGGAIIADKWILTSAKCKLNPNYITQVRAGVIESNCGENATDGQLIPILRPIPHPDFEIITYLTNINDIALLELAYPLEFNEHVQPIRIAKSNEQFGNVSKILGWGVESNEQLKDENHKFKCAKLHVAETKEMDNEDCNNGLTTIMEDVIEKLQRDLMNLAHHLTVREQITKKLLAELQAAIEDESTTTTMVETTEPVGELVPNSRSHRAVAERRNKVDVLRQICIGGNDVDSNVCAGDLGVPLIQTAASGEDVLVGIASIIHPHACETTTPSVFTKIAHYADWIESVAHV